METEEQERFLNDFDLIQIHPKVQQRHIEFLKTIDDENQSKAIRIAIDNYMNQTKITKIKDYLLIILVCLIFILGVYQIIVL